MVHWSMALGVGLICMVVGFVWGANEAARILKRELEKKKTKDE